MASTARRFDRSSDQWVDGDRVIVTVNCWKRLADGTHATVHKGDPVVVSGRLRTREYECEGRWRSSTGVDANAVGIDLARKVAPRVTGPPEPASDRMWEAAEEPTERSCATVLTQLSESPIAGL